MSDRFKFRIWINNKMHDVFYYYKAKNGVIFACTDLEDNTGFNTDGSTLMQSTGLKDKNGKLIYEGDVVKTYSYRCNLIVTWFKNKFILVPYSDYQDKDKYASERINGYRYFENNNRYANERDEVIGNIYENPELLRG